MADFGVGSIHATIKIARQNDTSADPGADGDVNESAAVFASCL
jgi:hypothetical protein